MSHDHDSGGAGYRHGTGASQGRILIALGLTSTFLVAEVAAGLIFNSLALLSDAAHMLTDVVALSIALAAVHIGKKPSDARRTWGYRRFEVLAAAFNAVLLFGVAGYVLYEGVHRFFAPEPVQSIGMLVVAGLGLLVNVIALRVLSGGRSNSLNIKAAYLEIWADLLGSIGVIGAALLIMATGWTWLDPVVAIGIGFWVLPRTWLLLRETTQVLVEGVPRSLDLDEVRTALQALPGVASLHDLHVWITGADLPTGSVHIVHATDADPQAVRSAVRALLHDRFKIEHLTIQVERAPDEPEGLHP